LNFISAAVKRNMSDSVKRTGVSRAWVATALTAMLAASMLGGCATGPALSYDSPAPAQVLSTTAAAGINDGRARFREIFCERFKAVGPPENGKPSCGDYLHRLVDEPTHGSKPDREPLPIAAMRFVMLGGYMDDSAVIGMRVFGTSVDRLASQGYRIEYLQVSGGGGAAYNAAQIAEYFRKRDFPERDKLVLIGYSKGTMDYMHFLVSYPDLARKVDALVSYSGAVNGSVLAEVFPQFLVDVAGFLGGSDAGDGKGFQSLKPSVQMQWLAENPLPARIKYFSLAAFTDRENVSGALVGGYDRLAQINPRNDGRLIFYNQILPHSTLLGYANGDHWAIALPFTEQSPTFAATIAGKNVFPRDAMLEALLAYIREAL
jgi:pimeloyl-ACP methyl ester carboxylesterase